MKKSGQHNPLSWPSRAAGSTPNSEKSKQKPDPRRRRHVPAEAELFAEVNGGIPPEACVGIPIRNILMHGCGDELFGAP